MEKNVTTCFLITFIVLLVYFQTGYSETCKPGNKPIHFIISNSLAEVIPTDFSQALYNELGNNLSEIGFCLKIIDSSALKDTSRYDELIMYMTTESKIGNEISTGTDLIVCLLRMEDWINGNIQISLKHPLLSISYQPDELSTFQSVLVKKIIENIRTQYVCHLRIQSNPSGVIISSPIGLEGKTPLEWILPVGNFSIYNKTEGYEPFQKKIDLSEPGIHTYFLELKKKQFYNSKFIIPTIVLALASAVCYGGERYYYSQYLKLGKEDYDHNPEKFADTYNKALFCERASLATLACTALSFTCTFVFK